MNQVLFYIFSSNLITSNQVRIHNIVYVCHGASLSPYRITRPLNNTTKPIPWCKLHCRHINRRNLRVKYSGTNPEWDCVNKTTGMQFMCLGLAPDVCFSAKYASIKFKIDCCNTRVVMNEEFGLLPLLIP